MDWQPMDTAIKDRTPILGYDGRIVRIIHWWNNGMSWVMIDTGGVPFEPKCWMPTPKTPEL